MLLKQLQADLVAARKNKDTLTKEILSYVVAIIQARAKDEQKELADDTIIQLLKKEVSMRQESLELLERVGRADEAAQEGTKIAVIRWYLPTMLDREQLQSLIVETVSELGIDDLRTQKGRLIGALMKDHKAVIDGKMMNEIIENWV